MGSGRRPGSDLPAPYESPWRRLAQDLRAVAASLWLRLWELSRRNRQGDLPLPSFWPPSLAPLFWPLLLVGVLVAGVAVTGVLGRAPEPSSPALASPVGNPVEAPSVVVPEPLPAPSEPVAPPPAPPPVPPSPLMEAMADTLGASLLREARAEPARGLLVLRVDGNFARLTAAERRERVEGWWAQALALGYERMELLGPGQGLLARSAVVGGGLVLYGPPPAPEGDPA